MELWRGFAKRRERERELRACLRFFFLAYSYTAREFNCEPMNLSLWRSLWAVHTSVYPPVRTVHLLYLMWFRNHSGRLLMKLIGCLHCRSLLLLFTGYLHPFLDPPPPSSPTQATRGELQRCTDDQGTTRRRRIGILLKGIGSLLWRKSDKSEETNEAKRAGMGGWGWTKNGRCVLMCTVRWSHTLRRGCMGRPLRKGIKEGGGWYADPLCRHHSEMLTSTAINNMQQANTA